MLKIKQNKKNKNNFKILNDYDTIESVDWFYNKYNIFISINPSLFCKPKLCSLGYLNKNEILNINKNQSGKCDYMILKYRKIYSQNKGKMLIDLTNSLDSILTLPSASE